ncbi:MAG: hypothetical protein HY777_01285 [Betaproteobacteria bacterium]|nr:hypothetical protein [Betaproteobacteria bacterium]
MNPELQNPLHVAAFPDALDPYMLIVLSIVVVAGLLGGMANYFLSDRLPELVRRDWAKYPLLGVVAALTVPLFLNMISSNLLETARTRPADLFVFTGFCLIYVIASRRLFENVAGKLLTQVDQIKREVKQIKQQQEMPREPREDPLPATETHAGGAKPDPVKESLSYDDIEILRALDEENYVYGNFVGLTEKTGLSRDLLGTRLIVLRNFGIIETRINERNVLHWFVSGKGRQLLNDFLAGRMIA